MAALYDIAVIMSVKPQPKKARKKPPRFNKTLSAASIFKGLLPAEYREKTGLIQQYQYFFEAQESDAVFQMVKVCNVTDEYLQVSVPNPALSVYLRMHAEEIKALMMENFGQALELKISSRPESAGESAKNIPLPPAPHFPQKVCQQVYDSANSVEDDALSAALKSLSKTIAK